MSAIDVVAGPQSTDVELVVVPYFTGAIPAAQTLTPDSSKLAKKGFEGKVGQTAVVDVGDRTVVAVGVGAAEEVTLDVLRKMGASAARAGWKYEKIEVHLPVGAGLSAELGGSGGSQAVTEGLVLAGYRFTDYKSQVDPRTLASVVVVDGDTDGVRHGLAVAAAVGLARDMINQPPMTMTPSRIAEIATDVAQRGDLSVEVLDENAIERERLGGLMGVSRGSDVPPRLIRLTYSPPNPRARVALVGKGITFDSGGLSIKPAEAMMGMKTDMSGAAAVISAMSVLSSIDVDVEVIGIVCATENMPGPKAIKPGDVLRARNGKTIEVLNTDAEGRLVLADGLSLAVEADVDAIVDVATLTGACMVALGTDIAGLMGNDDALRARIQSASTRTGENVWHLPLPKQYRKHIDSEIADIKNIGAPRGAAGTLTAGLFLQEFVGDKPWVHLDIAGVARADGDEGYLVKGGTGFGVRLLIDLLRHYD